VACPIFARGGLKLRVLLGKFPPPQNRFKAPGQTIAPACFGGGIYPGRAGQGRRQGFGAFAILGVCFLARLGHFFGCSWLDHNFSKSKICGEPSPAPHLSRGVHGWKDPTRGVGCPGWGGIGWQGSAGPKEPGRRQGLGALRPQNARAFVISRRAWRLAWWVPCLAVGFIFCRPMEKIFFAQVWRRSASCSIVCGGRWVVCPFARARVPRMRYRTSAETVCMVRGASAADSGKWFLPEYLSFSEKRSEKHLLSYGARCIFKVSPFFQAYVLRLFFAWPKVSPLAAVAWFPWHGGVIFCSWRYNGIIIFFK